MCLEGKIKKIVLWALALLGVVVALYGLFVVTCSASAFKQLEEGKYHEALLTFNKIPDLTQEISNGRKFANAGDLMDQGKYDESRALFVELGSFNGANLIFREIEYRQAKDKLLKEDYSDAIDMFASLGNYMDSQILLEYAQKELYEKAVGLYENGEIPACTILFEKIGKYEDAGKYRILTSPKSLEEILSILDFKNAKEVLLKSKFLEEFLCGTWCSGNYTFIAKIESGEFLIAQNLLAEYKESYIIENGYLLSNTNSQTEKLLEISIAGKDKISVLVISTGKTYTLKRQ